MSRVPLFFAAALAVVFPTAVPGRNLLIEAEGFSNRGGWVVDSQFMDIMGSPYLLAHGLGVAVADASTEATVPAAGTYQVWVRTKDWVAQWKAPGTPGRFQVSINGRALKTEFGTVGAEWHWQHGGAVSLPAGKTTLTLHDLTGFEGRCDAILLASDPKFRPPNRDPEMGAFRRACLGIPGQPERGGECHWRRHRRHLRGAGGTLRPRRTRASLRAGSLRRPTAMTASERTIRTQGLSWREKISYGAADMGFNFYWANIATFLMIFYTDVFGITAAAAGSMLFAIKIINAFTDPIIGAAADRTRTRFGKFRPYLVWMALPLAAAGVLTYTTPNLSEGGKLIWAYGTYLLMMVCYTGINIPYNALSGVLSSNPQERSTVNGLRFIFAFGGSMLVTAATPLMVKWLGQGNERLGWQLTMILWGVAATGVFLVTFFNTRERVESLALEPSNVRQDVKDLARNGPWVVLFFLALIIMLTITLRTSTAAYYFKYYVKRPELMSAFVPAYMAAAALGAALTPVLTRFFDKKRLLIVLMSTTGFLSAAFFFIPSDQIALMFVLQVATGLVLGPKSPLAFSMYADTADYNEWRTGRRATALTFAAATFSQKLGTAVAAAVMGWVFTALGYVANAEQTSRSQTGILLLMSFLPAFFAFVAAGVMLFYRLDRHALARIENELTARKAALAHAKTN